MIIEHAPVLAIAIPLFAAFLLPLLAKIGKNARNVFVDLALLLSGFFVFALSYNVFSSGIYVYTLGATAPSLTSPWGFPVRIILEIDAMNSFISVIAISIIIFVFFYLWKFVEVFEKGKEKINIDKVYILFLLLTTGILGMSFTGDFFTLFVFLEITSISSAALISFFKGSAFEAAFKFMIVSAVGALFLLFGIGILYGEYGLLNMGAIASMITNSFLDRVALAMIVSGLLLKIGSVPVHMWKPDAYQKAPSPIIVVCLISSLVGVYVLFRILFSVFFVFHLLFGWIIILLGILSIFAGVTMALPQKDFKRMLGYIAIAEIGYIMLGMGTGLVSPNSCGIVALSGGLFHIMNDVLDVGLLFLIFGSLVYLTKNNLKEVSGLAYHSISLPLLFSIGMFAVSGMPPFNGFVSKLMIYESVFCLNPLLSVVGILGSILMLAILVKIFVSIFLGKPYKKDIKIPFTMTAVMWVFALLIIFLGIFPNLPMNYFIKPAVNALINNKAYIYAVIGWGLT